MDGVSSPLFLLLLLPSNPQYITFTVVIIYVLMRTGSVCRVSSNNNIMGDIDEVIV